ncbi:MAG: helix-turn-helix transcriptional regulator [Ruminococcus sp.]|nr:helix-turn-helix transcriptional regulator [Ruminococcus sp.]
MKAVRLERGYTQSQLAEAVAISRVNLAYYESGRRIPSVAVLAEIADTLDCSVDKLLDRYQYTNKKE